jgi:hypothetical protein
MELSPEQLKEIERMPEALRSLVEAELNSGNAIEEIGHSFPAAPVGCYVKLARPVSSRPRESGKGVDFYDRNTSNYSGEFTDDRRHFFVLEPPHPPEPEPDMDAIRAAAQPKNQPIYTPPWTVKEESAPSDNTAVGRFVQSMQIDFEKWHDGIGYDIDILRKATPEELVAIENLLINRPVSDWRDVEALAALDSPRARTVLKKTLLHGNHELRAAVINHAPHMVSDSERTVSLVAALNSADIYGGLSQALDQVEEFHPPEVIDALFRGLLERDGEAAVNFAGMLMFIHGKTSEPFDWDQRPFFLLFHADKPAERREHFRELCRRIDVDADSVLKRLGM